MAESDERESPSLAELRRSEELNRRLLEAMPGGIVHVSIDGAIQHANAEAQRFLGMSQDALTKRYTQDWVPETIFEDGSPCSLEAYPVTQALMTGEAQAPVTIGVRRPDGHVGWAVFTAVPLLDGDQTTGAVVTFVDITQRRELEKRLQQVQTMEAIGRLAGGIAHDFNNLLTVIVGNAQSLRETIDDEQALDELADITRAAKHASDLTRQLLDFARRRKVESRTVFVEAIVAEVLPVLRHLVGKTIDIDTEGLDGQTSIDVDPGQFERVLINLCTNARDAMPKGGRLEIGIEPGADSVRLWVADRGRGMSPEEIERAFEPFFSRKFGRGSGLGLATVHAIVVQTGGSIEIDSRVGEGTRFDIRLPRSARVPEIDPADGETGTEPYGERVLVIEDEGLVRDMVGRALTNMGYRVSLAESSEEAYARFAAREFDLVLSDVLMPGLDGPALAKRLRSERPELPVVFMSGYAEDHDMVECGHTAYLAKPFAPADLERVLSRLLESAR